MKTTRSAKLLGLTLAAGLAVAACGSDSDSSSSDTTSSDTTATTEATTGTTEATTGGEAVSLAGDCPETVAIQLDWMPEAEHGFLYQMIGEGYEVDAGKAYVTGPLIDANGNDTGVKIQIRSGGAAQNFSPVTQIMYANDDVLLGFVYTDEAIQFSGDFPTVAIESGYEKNPQMIMWDPATYPDVTGIADLGTEGVKVRYFGGAAYMDFLTGSGVLSADQVDGSYTGDPSLFIADEGTVCPAGLRLRRAVPVPGGAHRLGQARCVRVHQRHRLGELRPVDRHQAGEHREVLGVLHEAGADHPAGQHRLPRRPRSDERHHPRRRRPVRRRLRLGLHPGCG